MDVWAEMASLQITSFLLNVCHVVVVVADELTTAPSQLHALIDRAASFKPTVYTPSVLSAREFAYNDDTEPCRPCPVVSEKRDRQAVDHNRVKSNTVAAAIARREVTETSVALNTCESDIDRLTTAQDEDNGVDIEGPTEEQDEIDNIGSLGADRIIGSAVVLDGSVNSEDPRTNGTRTKQFGSKQYESSDVMEALNQLRGLTDYCASLIHVYNQAPSEAFLDPHISDKIRLFHQQLLPHLYPNYRRLAAQMTCTPRLLTAHLNGQPTHMGVEHRGPIPVRVIDKVSSGLIQPRTVVEPGENAPIDRNPSVSKELLDLAGPSSGDAMDGVESSPIYRTTEISPCEQQPPSSGSMASPMENADAYVATPIDVSQAGSGSLVRDQGMTELSGTVKASRRSKQRIKEIPPQSDHPSGPTEAEIVAQCCSVIHAVQSDLVKSAYSVKSTLKDDNMCFEVESDSVKAEHDRQATHSQAWDEENVHARMTRLTHRINAVRREFFHVQRRLNNPRMFLVPEVDEEGHSPIGCSAYTVCVQQLQEAIFSTPRQHMVSHMTEKKWLAYAEKMWNAVSTSPILQDYHSILLD